MEEPQTEFPGFHIFVPKDEFLSRKLLSRLQRKAPTPLPLKPATPLECMDRAKALGWNLDCSSSSSSSSSGFYHDKTPIPLLSPLVLPSLPEPSAIQNGSTASQSSATAVINCQRVQ
uniref:Uncharacterized protein n=1 Tax=Nelumbo nucifera TaxID=4432 RepID=A0A822Z0V5_NELNU|nr:TPA_asm: hypothetical protein HUJ06_005748 [Nelumbo nucifera]